MGVLDRFFKRGRCSVGIDIGSRSVKVAVVEKEGGAFGMRDAFIFPLPSGTIEEGRVVDEDALVDVLKAVKKAVSRGDFVAVLPSTASLVATFELPEDTAEEQIDYLVVEEIAKKIPVSISEVSFDYCVVELDGKRYVNAVIGKKKVIRRFLSIYEKAGISLDSITSVYTALSNAFLVNYPDEGEKCAYLVDVGHGVSTFCFLKGGLMIHGRSSSLGTEKVEEYVASALNIDASRVREIMGAGEIDERVLNEAVESFAGLLAEELEACSVFCEHHASFEKSGSISVYISGEATELPRFVPLLSASLSENFKAFQLDPFRKVAIPDDLAAYIADVKGSFAVAVGAGVS